MPQDLLVQRCAGRFQQHFEQIKYHVEVDADPARDVVTEATVKVHVAGSERHEVAEGDGPVNALDAALRKALNGTFPGLREMRLVDYKVRILDTGAGTEANVRVLIESTDGERVWNTVGSSTDVIEASWLALTDALEYYLLKQPEWSADV